MFTVLWNDFNGDRQQQQNVRSEELAQFIQDMMQIDFATNFDFLVE